MTKFEVHATWDVVEDVWVARSDDIPGLTAKAATWGELKLKLAMLGQELIEQNNIPVDEDGGQLHIVSEETVSLEWC